MGCAHQESTFPSALEAGLLSGRCDLDSRGKCVSAAEGSDPERFPISVPSPGAGPVTQGDFQSGGTLESCPNTSQHHGPHCQQKSLSRQPGRTASASLPDPPKKPAAAEAGRAGPERGDTASGPVWPWQAGAGCIHASLWEGPGPTGCWGQPSVPKTKDTFHIKRSDLGRWEESCCGCWGSGWAWEQARPCLPSGVGAHPARTGPAQLRARGLVSQRQYSVPKARDLQIVMLLLETSWKPLCWPGEGQGRGRGICRRVTL